MMDENIYIQLSVNWIPSCHLLFRSSRICIWLCPSVAEGDVILAAVKPDSQDRQSNLRDNSSRNLTVRQLPQTELEEQEKLIISAGPDMSAGKALSLGAIYSTAGCHFDLLAVDEVCASRCQRSSLCKHAASINTSSLKSVCWLISTFVPFLSLQGDLSTITGGVRMKSKLWMSNGCCNSVLVSIQSQTWATIIPFIAQIK